MEQATKCATGLTLKVLSPTKFLLGCTSLFYSVFSILKQFRKSWGPWVVGPFAVAFFLDVRKWLIYNPTATSVAPMWLAIHGPSHISIERNPGDWFILYGHIAQLPNVPSGVRVPAALFSTFFFNLVVNLGTHQPLPVLSIPCRGERPFPKSSPPPLWVGEVYCFFSRNYELVVLDASLASRTRTPMGAPLYAHPG